MPRGDFDPDKMKKRSIAKYERRKMTDVVDAALVLQRELIAIDGMERLVTWLEKKKISLKIKKMAAAEYEYENKMIYMSGGLSRERQLIFLIHECGHVLVGSPKRNERFGMTEILKGERCTFRHRIDVVEEEFEAWYRGKKLAKRLKVKYDTVRWDQEKQWALVTYLKWAVQDEDYNDGDYSDMREDPDVKKRRRRVNNTTPLE